MSLKTRTTFSCYNKAEKQKLLQQKGLNTQLPLSYPVHLMKNGNEILNDVMVIFQQQNKIIVIATNIEIVKHVICLEHTHTAVTS